MQTRSADAEEAQEEGKDAPKRHEFHHKEMKHPDSWHILRRTYNEKGFLGLYQVRCPTYNA